MGREARVDFFCASLNMLINSGTHGSSAHHRCMAANMETTSARSIPPLCLVSRSRISLVVIQVYNESGSRKRQTQVSLTTLSMKDRHPVSQASMSDWVISQAFHSSSIFCRSSLVASSLMLGSYDLKVSIMGLNLTVVPRKRL